MDKRTDAKPAFAVDIGLQPFVMETSDSESMSGTARNMIAIHHEPIMNRDRCRNQAAMHKHAAQC